MGLWKTVFAVLFALLVFQSSTVETKKRKKDKSKNLLQVETLQKLCHGSLPASIRKNILELQAFFDLSKAFACLKVETCSRVPVCFVEDTPDLGHESLSDCTLWNNLLQGLQKHRRIEPVYDNPMSARNNGKSRIDSSWDEVVSSLCHGANVYRFINSDSGEERNTSKNGTASHSSTRSTVTPVTKNTNKTVTTSSNGRSRRRRTGGPLNKFIRQLLKSNKRIHPNNNATCEILSNCTRICVGQNEELTNVSDCSRFKIHCTFRKSSKNRKNRKSKSSSKSNN